MADRLKALNVAMKIGKLYSTLNFLHFIFVLSAIFTSSTARGTENTKAFGLSSNTEMSAGDQPIRILPEPKIANKTMVIVVSGDGGWSSFDQNISQSFVDAGMHVIGIDALRFFWNAKSPEEAASEFQRINRQYMAQWNLKRVLWVGQGMGADALPFLVNRVDGELKPKVRGLALLGASESANFERQESHWLSVNEKTSGQSLRSELDQLTVATLCFAGKNEARGCRGLSKNGNIRNVIISTEANHLSTNKDRIVATILRLL